jgi:thioesterase domain-containing protein
LNLGKLFQNSPLAGEQESPVAVCRQARWWRYRRKLDPARLIFIDGAHASLVRAPMTHAQTNSETLDTLQSKTIMT